MAAIILFWRLGNAFIRFRAVSLSTISLSDALSFFLAFVVSRLDIPDDYPQFTRFEARVRLLLPFVDNRFVADGFTNTRRAFRTGRIEDDGCVPALKTTDHLLGSIAQNVRRNTLGVDGRKLMDNETIAISLVKPFFKCWLSLRFFGRPKWIVAEFRVTGRLLSKERHDVEHVGLWQSIRPSVDDGKVDGNLGTSIGCATRSPAGKQAPLLPRSTGPLPLLQVDWFNCRQRFQISFLMF